jgi:hypothetical protein
MQKGQTMPEHDNRLLVSIVIPVYNGADYLGQAIDSALAQTWPHIEIIVVDDGSDDGGRTAQIARSYGERVRYHYKGNGGVATAINTGIRLMRGSYFSWLSHDDVFVADKIERQIQALLAHDGPAMAFGDFGLMDADGGDRTEVRVGDAYVPGRPLLGLMRYMVNGCAVLVHRACLADLWLDPGLPSTQDYDLWLRIAAHHPLIHVPGVAVYSRQHAAQGSRSPRFLDEVLLLWSAVLDRLESSLGTRRALLGETPDYAGLMSSPAVAHLPALRAHVQRGMAEQARGARVAVVMVGDCEIGACERLADRLLQAGIVLCGIWGVRPPQSQVHAVRLQWAGGREVDLHLSAEPLDQRAHALLARASAHSGAEFVWLVDASAPSVATLSLAVPCLRARPAVVVCLQEGRGQDVLGGAVFRSAPLRAACEGTPASLSALVHALVRGGGEFATVAPAVTAELDSEVVVPVATALVTPAPLPEQAVARAGHRQPAWPMRVSFVLVRRPAWAGLAWRLMRTAWGAQARERLLHWTGLHGRMDPTWYLRAYPEVASAGVDPVFHYLVFGQREGRDPAPNFNTQAYLSQYPQVAHKKLNALQHHVAWGSSLGHQAQESEVGSQPPEVCDARAGLLLVLDGQSADAVRFANDLALQMSASMRTLYLVGAGTDDGWVFGSDPCGRYGRRLDAVQHRAVLAELVCCHDVRRVLVLDHGGLGAATQMLLMALALPYDLVLLGRDADHAACELTSQLALPERLRLRQAAAKVFVTSQALAQQLCSDDPSLEPIVAPPPDPQRLRGFRPWMRPVSADGVLRVALFGLITEASGRQVVLGVLREIRRRQLPIRLMMFGQATPPLPHEDEDAVQYWPALHGRALLERVVATRPHLAWFPCQTWVANGYTLTDVESVGLPIAASDVGEAAERLRCRPLSWLLPADTTADGWLDWFVQLELEKLAAMPGAVLDPFGQRFHDADAYRRHLLSLG